VDHTARALNRRVPYVLQALLVRVEVKILLSIVRRGPTQLAVKLLVMYVHLVTTAHPPLMRLSFLVLVERILLAVMLIARTVPPDTLVTLLVALYLNALAANTPSKVTRCVTLAPQGNIVHLKINRWSSYAHRVLTAWAIKHHVLLVLRALLVRRRPQVQKRLVLTEHSVAALNLLALFVQLDFPVTIRHLLYCILVIRDTTQWLVISFVISARKVLIVLLPPQVLLSVQWDIIAIKDHLNAQVVLPVSLVLSQVKIL